MKKLYMAVSADQYELPLYVADTAKELAEWSGVKPNYVSTAIYYKYSGKKMGMKFVKVELEED